MIRLRIAAIACAAIAAVYYGQRLLLYYGPDIREFLLWAITPQFAMGMMFMATLVAIIIISIIWSDR